ncbi:S8 family serine peptidase [Bacillus mangrovi]|uniref:S8 family serine peptidase n=1 Tax=Metabacillus mangrovi TaxID=1491830 RepID=A0A7X2S5X8_9BACI|nr:S8 family serine peptidase [Metabacillus mangrovi]MTH54022.1 S8 family serine peptidase [Metabacillus mangrovi]
MKRGSVLALILILALIPRISSLTYTYPQRPPLPKPALSTTETRIIVAKPGEWARLSAKLRFDFPHIKIRRTYQNVFQGASLEGAPADLDRLAALPEVENSGPVTTYQTENQGYVPYVGGDKARGLFDSKNQRLTGKGVKVGIIDTGMDYMHPDLFRNYAGGYDLVDGDRYPMETKGKYATLHGTHVAGIIAANGKIKGIAPEASLYIYRALGPAGMGTSEWIIAAIDRAVKDKVDVLNLSLGNDVNGPDWPTSLALDKAVEKGVIAVAAAGNSGPGKWTLGSPATAGKAITVGASTPPIRIFSLKIADQLIKITPLQGAASWKAVRNLGMADAGFGRENDFPQNVKGKLVITRRGKSSFEAKARTAERKGAAGLLVYNSEKGAFSGSVKRSGIPAASISREDGMKVKKLISQTGSIVEMKEEDTIASFSSRGPVTVNWQIKPDLVAPGVAITSTIPGKQYKTLQGTSMAAPLVAGAAALMKQAHPDWKPEEVKAALMNTSVPLKRESNDLYEPIEQGAGRLDAWRALQAEVLIVPGSLVFSKFESGKRRTAYEAKIKIVNHSDTAQKVRFSYPPKSAGLTWKIPGAETVDPRSSKNITIGLEGTPMHLVEGTHQGRLEAFVGRERFSLPYLYMMDEPDYPRLMGFELERGEEPGTLAYQVYLPGGADEIGIALYDSASYHFTGYLDWKENVGRGRMKRILKLKDLNIPPGTYKALIFARKGKAEDVIEATIAIDNYSQR